MNFYHPSQSISSFTITISLVITANFCPAFDGQGCCNSFFSMWGERSWDEDGRCDLISISIIYYSHKLTISHYLSHKLTISQYLSHKLTISLFVSQTYHLIFVSQSTISYLICLTIYHLISHICLTIYHLIS